MDVLATGHPVAGENLQARLRAIIVMGYANANGSMAETTGNKSEIAQGYCTLYGDMAGGYAPLGDVYKMEVYAMAERFNQRASEQGQDRTRVVFNLDQTAFGRIGTRPDGPRHAAAL